MCVSVNEIVCHGIPSLRPFKTGDYVNFDVTTYINGVYGDTSAMATVGKVPDEVDDIITTTYDCLYKAIDICEPGVKINKIGEIIENHAKTKGFTVCREFIGHGIGIEMHMAPPVVHNSNLYIGNNEESIMRPGMVFTIEPILIMNKDYRLGIW